jgi:hypothetical protein
VRKGCEKGRVVIGHAESFQLDAEPAKYFVLVSKREKRACKSCECCRVKLTIYQVEGTSVPERVGTFLLSPEAESILRKSSLPSF